MSSVLGLYSAAGVHAEELEAIFSSSFPTEAEFGVTSLGLACADHQLIVGM